MSAQFLPNELLLPVFKDVVKQYSLETPMDLFMQNVHLSQVCRWWRELAISRQEFWDVVPQKHSGLTEMCLMRCSTEPLQVVIDASQAQSSEYRASIRLVFAHFRRVRRLHAGLFEVQMESYPQLRLDPANPINHDMRWPDPAMRIMSSAMQAEESLLNEVLQKLCDQSARDLEELKISFGGRNRMLWTMIPPAVVRNVRAVSLTRCMPPPSRYRFAANVRSLELVDVIVWTTMAGIIQFFQAVPLLEHFVYKQADHREEGPPNAYWQAALPAPRSVRLERLRTFRLAGPILGSYVVFSCLSFPRSSTLVIQSACAEHFMSGELYMALIVRIRTALQMHFSVGNGEPRSASPVDAVLVKAEHLVLVTMSPDDGYARPLSLLMCFDEPRYPWHRHADLEADEGRRVLNEWRDLTSALPAFGQAKTLVFEKGFMDIYDRHRAILSRFPLTETIQVRESVDIWALYSAVRNGGLFPHLRCVRFVNAILDGMKRSTLERLIDTLRELHGDVAMRMEFYRCEVGLKMMEDLVARMYPWRLYWDEYKKDEMPLVLGYDPSTEQLNAASYASALRRNVA